MKTRFAIIGALILALVISCEDPGVTRNEIQGTEVNLPPELKGLKIYDVSIGAGSSVKVGVLDNEVKGLEYTEGKYNKSVVMISKNKDRVIEIESIISENDSIIVVKKAKK